MENATQLSERVREVLLDGTWIANTNFQDQLSRTTWEEATRKIGSLNTIAGLTYHVNYYLAGLIHVFEGGNLEIRDKYSFDVPEIRSIEAWERLREDLMTHAEAFAKHVEDLSVEKLDSVFVEERYGSYRRNIEGVIEHCYYHLGQLALLRKWMDMDLN